MTTPIFNIGKDQKSMEVVDEIITQFRLALAPMMWKAGDDLHALQSLIISSAAMHAGITIGHMVAIGVLPEAEEKRALKVVLVAARSGIKLGKKEALDAMIRQNPPAGRA